MLIGQVLNDRYEIVDFIGQGGMAKVYLGYDRSLNRDVAIKVLQEEFEDNEQFLKKFKREAQSAGKLSHPHIVSVFDTGYDRGLYYIVMEYVDGGTLKDYIEAKGKLSYRESINYTLAIASALGQAHKNNIIHRDVKPQNILLTRARRLPKVADFGIAKAITSSTMTMVDETMGSVHYISPEQARGGFLDERSDLYSLGILLYEMLTGQLPFDSDSPVAVALMQIQEEITPVRELEPDVPEGLENVIKNLTAKSPDNRYQNASMLIEDLKKIREDADVYIPLLADEDAFKTDAIPVVREDKPRKNIKKKSVPKENKENPKKEAEKKKGVLGFLSRLSLKGKILLGLLSVLLIIGIIFGATRLFAKDVTVPNVKNMEITKAQEALDKAGVKYRIEKEEYSVDVDKNHVISQTPGKGSVIKSYVKVALVVSKGAKTEEVPDVIGKSEEDATKILEDLKFKVDVKKRYSDKADKGDVYNQNPVTGVTAKQGTVITIYVSKGDNTVELPDLSGMSLSQAKSKLEELDLNVGNVSESSSSKYSANTVISTSPSSGSKVERGSSVDIVVSRGKTKTKNISIDLGSYSNNTGQKYRTQIIYTNPDGKKKTVYSGAVRDTDTISVSISGYGVGYYTVYIDGQNCGTGAVTF